MRSTARRETGSPKPEGIKSEGSQRRYHSLRRGQVGWLLGGYWFRTAASPEEPRLLYSSSSQRRGRFFIASCPVVYVMCSRMLRCRRRQSFGWWLHDVGLLITINACITDIGRCCRRKETAAAAAQCRFLMSPPFLRRPGCPPTTIRSCVYATGRSTVPPGMYAGGASPRCHEDLSGRVGISVRCRRIRPEHAVRSPRSDLK